jgi:hypothetical membrane protein
MRTIHLIAAVSLLFFGIAAPEIIGALTPGYSSQSNFLSELGQTGAPYAALMNFGVFLPVGLLWAIGMVCVWRAIPAGALGAIGAALLFGNSVSYIGAAFFPCDAGCPGEGSFNQLMHNLTGAVGYFLSPPAFAMLGAHLVGKGRAAFGAVTLLAAAVTGLAFARMVTDLESDDAGLWQRLTDYSQFLWMLAAAFLSRKS